MHNIRTSPGSGRESARKTDMRCQNKLMMNFHVTELKKKTSIQRRQAQQHNCSIIKKIKADMREREDNYGMKNHFVASERLKMRGKKGIKSPSQAKKTSTKRIFSN